MTMIANETCPRCADCANSDHHWIEDDGPCDDSPWPCYACKHCEAIGADCPRCGNGGRTDTCLRCEGEGIVPATAFLCDGWPVVESGPFEAANAHEIIHGARPMSVVSAPIAGRCESCWGLLVEGTDYMTDRDGDGKWCRECGEDEADEEEDNDA
jgi:hypothetical protein